MLFYEDYRYYDEYTIDDAMNFVQESQNSYNSFIDYCIEQEQICLQETGKEEYITEGAIKDIFRRVIELITGLIKRIREALGRLFKKLPKPITTKPSGNNSNSSNNKSNNTTKSLPAGSSDNVKSLPAGSNSNTKLLPVKTYHITLCSIEGGLNCPMFFNSLFLRGDLLLNFKELKDFENLNLKEDKSNVVRFLYNGFNQTLFNDVTFIEYDCFNTTRFVEVNTIDKFKEFLNKKVFNEKYEKDCTIDDVVELNKKYYEPYMKKISEEMHDTKGFEEAKSELESVQKAFSTLTKEDYDGDNYELAMSNLTKYITTLGQWCTIICSYQTTMATMFVQYVSKKINQMNHIINND